MFKLKPGVFFKKIINNPPNLGLAQPNLYGKSVNEIIDEIHHTFYTEVDRLLEEASVSHSLETQYETLIQKRERLIKLGFTNTKEVIEATKEVERLESIRSKNNMNEKLKRAIEYFSKKYPLYKFITEESVLKICNRYGLILGDINKFIGGVPDKNLKQIEYFKIDEKDAAYFKYHHDYNKLSKDGFSYLLVKSFFNKTETEAYIVDDRNFRGGKPKRCGFEIAATKNDFDTKDMEVQNFQLLNSVKDPVVFMPVIHEGQRHFLIVSAWGQEASDPDVVNQINN